MLQELRVTNLALIDTLQLDFTSHETGLIVLTGETGAGKSIILQAIHLLTGGRGSSSWIRGNCEQAMIEACFEINEEHTEINDLLQEHELAADRECIIRRVLSLKGRSRVYINDRLVTARLAGELTENLVNIASQHDHQQLLNSRRHLDFLDSFGELWEKRRSFTLLFNRWQKISRSLRQLQGKEQDKEQRRDFLEYQLAEIREAAITPGEDEQLILERDRLKSSGTLAELAGHSHRLLRGKIVDSLVDIRKNMEQAATLDPEVKELSERISSACFEVEDLEGALRSYRDSIPMDPMRLDEISARLALLKQMQRKYGVTLEDVLAFAEKAGQELATLNSLEQEIAELELEQEKAGAEVLRMARELSVARRKAADRLTAAMQQELASLSFYQAVFEVSMTTPKKPGMDGMQAIGGDQVEFLFSANPGEQVKSLARVVSGGELSRLMLAMKCLLARRDQVDTVIFDEVDAGIGGQAAEAVAVKISQLAGHHQVFCITHLPQIAARADSHFMVEKKVEKGRTTTTIRELTTDERIAELARMLGGEAPTEQTLAFARELVEQKGNKSTAWVR